MRYRLAFIAMLLSCAHGLQPCKACGPGYVCMDQEAPGGMAFQQCFRHCNSDRDCPAANHCNCDEDACTVHSGRIPFNVCVASERPTAIPELQYLLPQADEQRSCSTCKPDEFCLDVGHKQTPVYKCFKQCTNSTDCPRPQVCNCAAEPNGFCTDDYSQGMCVEKPAPANGSITH